MAEYWRHVGVVESALCQNTAKVEGFSWIEVLSTWVRHIYPGAHVVVLTNVEASAKGVAFWSRLPKDRVEDLLQDVVVLRCKDKPEVFRLVESITPVFADAYGFSAGELVGTNLESEV